LRDLVTSQLCPFDPSGEARARDDVKGRSYERNTGHKTADTESERTRMTTSCLSFNCTSNIPTNYGNFYR
jgi:hypothetical protein